MPYPPVPFTPVYRPMLHLSGMGGSAEHRARRIELFRAVLLRGWDRGWWGDLEVENAVKAAVAEVEQAPLEQEWRIMLKYVDIY